MGSTGKKVRKAVHSAGRFVAAPFEAAGHTATGDFGKAEDDLKNIVKYGSSAITGGTMDPFSVYNESSPKKAADPVIDIGRVGDEEAQQIATSRLARLSKYFAGSNSIFGAAKKMFGG